MSESPPKVTLVQIEPQAVSSDLALARAVVRRDRKATAEFVQTYSGPVYQYVRRRLAPDFSAVDDTVQETFLAAWGQLAAFRGDASLKTWLLGIARHKVEDHYRSRLRERLASEEESAEIVSSAPLPDQWLDDRRTEERARRILDSLPEHYRLALRWRYWEKRSCQEMAASTGRSEKAVERLLARARDLFRKRWTHE